MLIRGDEKRHDVGKITVSNHGQLSFYVAFHAVNPDLRAVFKRVFEGFLGEIIEPFQVFRIARQKQVFETSNTFTVGNRGV